LAKVPIIAVVEVSSSFASNWTFSVFFALEIAIVLLPQPVAPANPHQRSMLEYCSFELKPRVGRKLAGAPAVPYPLFPIPCLLVLADRVRNR
jgi:hypothetical protein